MEALVAGALSGIAVGLWFRFHDQRKGIPRSERQTPSNYLVLAVVLGCFSVLALLTRQWVVGTLGVVVVAGALVARARAS